MMLLVGLVLALAASLYSGGSFLPMTAVIIAVASAIYATKDRRAAHRPAQHDAEPLTSFVPIADETGRSEPLTSLVPIAPQVVNRKFRIDGFHRAMKGGAMKGTPRKVKSELLCGPESSPRGTLLQSDSDSPINTERSKTSVRFERGGAGLSARSQGSARSARSDTSQRIIDELQARIAKLDEPVAQASDTPRSARSDTSQRIIDGLHARIAKMTEERNNQTPRSARSDFSQRITPRSARSDISSSQRIIDELKELKEEIASLKSERTPTFGSALSFQERLEQCVESPVSKRTQKKNRKKKEKSRLRNSNLDKGGCPTTGDNHVASDGLRITTDEHPCAHELLTPTTANGVTPGKHKGMAIDNKQAGCGFDFDYWAIPVELRTELPDPECPV